MSLIRNGYAVFGRRGSLGLLLSAFLALALFDSRATTAQEVKQIKLTEKQIQSFMAAYEDMAKLYDGTQSDKPEESEGGGAGRGSRQEEWFYEPRSIRRCVDE